MGAIHSFLPELRPFINDRPDGRTEWRTTLLPSWNESSSFEFPIDWMPPSTADQLPTDAEIETLRQTLTAPPSPTAVQNGLHARPTESTFVQHLERLFRAPDPPRSFASAATGKRATSLPENTPLQYRWLPLRGATHHGPDDTPIRRTEYNPFGTGWSRWPIAAQEHLSFFSNLEVNNLDVYKFAVWDFNYERMGIQFIAMMGVDINVAKPIEKDDERHFSETMTKRTRRREFFQSR
jgi:hypothetical protein